MEPLERIDHLAALARLDEPPAIRVDVRVLAQRCRPAQPPVFLLWTSAAVSGLAACVVLSLALRMQTETLTGTAVGNNQSSTTSSSSSDAQSVLFSPLEMEVP